MPPPKKPKLGMTWHNDYVPHQHFHQSAVDDQLLKIEINDHGTSDESEEIQTHEQQGDAGHLQVEAGECSVRNNPLLAVECLDPGEVCRNTRHEDMASSADTRSEETKFHSADQGTSYTVDTATREAEEGKRTTVINCNETIGSLEISTYVAESNEPSATSRCHVPNVRIEHLSKTAYLTEEVTCNTNPELTGCKSGDFKEDALTDTPSASSHVNSGTRNSAMRHETTVDQLVGSQSDNRLLPGDVPVFESPSAQGCISGEENKSNAERISVPGDNPDTDSVIISISKTVPVSERRSPAGCVPVSGSDCIPETICISGGDYDDRNSVSDNLTFPVGHNNNGSSVANEKLIPPKTICDADSEHHEPMGIDGSSRDGISEAVERTNTPTLVVDEMGMRPPFLAECDQNRNRCMTNEHNSVHTIAESVSNDPEENMPSAFVDGQTLIIDEISNSNKTPNDEICSRRSTVDDTEDQHPDRDDDAKLVKKPAKVIQPLCDSSPDGNNDPKRNSCKDASYTSAITIASLSEHDSRDVDHIQPETEESSQNAICNVRDSGCDLVDKVTDNIVDSKNTPHQKCTPFDKNRFQTDSKSAPQMNRINLDQPMTVGSTGMDRNSRPPTCVYNNASDEKTIQRSPNPPIHPSLNAMEKCEMNQQVIDHNERNSNAHIRKSQNDIIRKENDVHKRHNVENSTPVVRPIPSSHVITIGHGPENNHHSRDHPKRTENYHYSRDHPIDYTCRLETNSLKPYQQTHMTSDNSQLTDGVENKCSSHRLPLLHKIMLSPKSSEEHKINRDHHKLTERANDKDIELYPSGQVAWDVHMQKEPQDSRQAESTHSKQNAYGYRQIEALGPKQNDSFSYRQSDPLCLTQTGRIDSMHSQHPILQKQVEVDTKQAGQCQAEPYGHSWLLPPDSRQTQIYDHREILHSDKTKRERHVPRRSMPFENRTSELSDHPGTKEPAFIRARPDQIHVGPFAHRHVEPLNRNDPAGKGHSDPTDQTQTSMLVKHIGTGSYDSSLQNIHDLCTTSHQTREDAEKIGKIHEDFHHTTSRSYHPGMERYQRVVISDGLSSSDNYTDTLVTHAMRPSMAHKSTSHLATVGSRLSKMIVEIANITHTNDVQHLNSSELEDRTQHRQRHPHMPQTGNHPLTYKLSSDTPLTIQGQTTVQHDVRRMETHTPLKRDSGASSGSRIGDHTLYRSQLPCTDSLQHEPEISIEHKLCSDQPLDYSKATQKVQHNVNNARNYESAYRRQASEKVRKWIFTNHENNLHHNNSPSESIEKAQQSMIRSSLELGLKSRNKHPIWQSHQEVWENSQRELAKRDETTASEKMQDACEAPQIRELSCYENKDKYMSWKKDEATKTCLPIHDPRVHEMEHDSNTKLQCENQGPMTITKYVDSILTKVYMGEMQADMYNDERNKGESVAKQTARGKVKRGSKVQPKMALVHPCRGQSTVASTSSDVSSQVLDTDYQRTQIPSSKCLQVPAKYVISQCPNKSSETRNKVLPPTGYNISLIQQEVLPPTEHRNSDLKDTNPLSIQANRVSREVLPPSGYKARDMSYIVPPPREYVGHGLMKQMLSPSDGHNSSSQNIRSWAGPQNHVRSSTAQSTCTQDGLPNAMHSPPPEVGREPPDSGLRPRLESAKEIVEGSSSISPPHQQVASATSFSRFHPQQPSSILPSSLPHRWSVPETTVTPAAGDKWPSYNQHPHLPSDQCLRQTPDHREASDQCLRQTLDNPEASDQHQKFTPDPETSDRSPRVIEDQQCTLPEQHQWLGPAHQSVNPEQQEPQSVSHQHSISGHQRTTSDGPLSSPFSAAPSALCSPVMLSCRESSSPPGEHDSVEAFSSASSNGQTSSTSDCDVTPPTEHSRNDCKVTSRHCQICDDTASGFHYGVWSCEGCKAFFKRSLQGPVDYICPATNNCTIDKHRRKSCQACRLRKCIETGMSRGSCREKKAYRQYQKYTKRKADSGDCEIICSKQARGSPNTPGSPSPIISPTECKKEPKVCPVQPLVEHPNTKPNHRSDIRSSVGMVHPLVQHLLNIEPHARLADHSEVSPQTPLTEVVLRLIDTELHDVVAWAKEVPGYMELNMSERMELMETSWTETILARLIWRSLPHNDVLVFAPNLHVSEEFAQADDLWPICRQALNIVQTFKHLDIKCEEMALIRVCLLLNAGIHNLDLEERFHRVQENVLEALQHTVLIQHGQSVNRITRLMLLLPQFRQLGLQLTSLLSTLRYQNRLPVSCKLIGEVLSSHHIGK